MPKDPISTVGLEDAFSPDFLWGAATAAYQVEGAAAEDGRGSSIWDDFTHSPGRSLNGDTGDIAADHYHRFREDVKLLADFGMNSYRFSIAWPRVIPEGKGDINEKGLEHYDRVIDTLLEVGVRPMVTVFHWDLPSALDGGWLNRDTAYRLADFTEIVVNRFGDRVPLWLTINEPWTVAIQGYARGLHAPGLRDYELAGTAIHHMMLGHGLAVERFRQVAPAGAEIGITLSMAVVRAWSSKAADVSAAALVDGEQNRVFLDPLFKASYPEDMFSIFPSLQRKDIVHAGDLKTISTPIDFLGVNYYLDNVVQSDPTVPVLGARLLQPLGPEMFGGIAAAPHGLYECISRVRAEWADLPIYVTEIGAAFPDYVDPDGAVNDPDRIEYITECVNGIAVARREGADVRGLFVWSLLDNLEWEKGYSIRFGLFYVDYRTQARIPKASAYWYRDLIKRVGRG